ncbi:hypothetical protein ACFQRF_26255, partial [Marinactinospora rubrisoli]
RAGRPHRSVPAASRLAAGARGRPVPFAARRGERAAAAPGGPMPGAAPAEASSTRWPERLTI